MSVPWTDADPMAYLEDHVDVLLETTETLVGADTQNPPGDTEAIADWIMAEFDALDIEYECFHIDPRKPNVVGTVPGTRDFTLLYNGHLDTVPYDESAWTSDPCGERDGDRLYGRGATDMKGAIGAMIQVARAYAETETTPPLTLQFAFVSDEEVAGDAGLATRLKCKRLDPDACIVGEATGRDEVNSIAVGDRSYIWPTLRARGRAAHGSRPMFGENAIDRLYTALTDCRRRLESVAVPTDPYAEVVLEEGVEYYASELDRTVAETLFSHPTVNLGTLAGGEATNSVPSSAEASLDIRVLPSVTPEQILSEIRECLSDRDGVDVADLTWSEGTYTDPETPFIEALTDVANHVLPTPVYRRFATGSGDAQVFREQGIPTVEFATGTGTAHAADEYTTVGKLQQNALAYAMVPFALDDQLETPGTGPRVD